ncbi:hypothetical protein RvVAR0630_26560 [Agrobacterium vitis]|nr:hypothetical protein RvVAR0630_26560 [Agrobacterium vitis]
MPYPEWQVFFRKTRRNAAKAWQYRSLGPPPPALSHIIVTKPGKYRFCAGRRDFTDSLVIGWRASDTASTNDVLRQTADKYQ